MSQKYITRKIPKIEINDNFDALYYSRMYNRLLRRSGYYFFFIPSKVERVGKGFSIDENLRITIASVRKLRGKGITNSNEMKIVYEGSLIHENMHALGFPMITRAKEVLTPVINHLSEIGVTVDENLLNDVENCISDVINEVLAVTKKIDKEGKLIPARYLYQVRNQEDTNNPLIEKSPSLLLLKKHNEVFRDKYMNRKPEFGNTKIDVIYQLITKFSKELDIEEHTYLVNVGGFSTVVIKNLIQEHNLFGVMDKFYEWYTRTSEVDENSKKRLQMIFSEIPEFLRLYALYYSLLFTFYRIDSSIPDNPIKLMSGKGFDKVKIPVPTKGESERILNKILTDNPITPSELDKITDNLLNEIISVRKPNSILRKKKSMEVTVPFYMNPRGRIDPLSIVKSRRGILDWEVYDEIEYTSIERGYSMTSPPDHFTALIDISGSTLYSSAILLPLVGTETSILDVERAIVIAMMKAMKRKGWGETKATIYLFESEVEKVEGPIDEMIEYLLDEEGEIYPRGGTDILKALRMGLKTHKDNKSNPFIIVTDLEISHREEVVTYNLITRKLKRSPILIVVIGDKEPVKLKELNKRKNIAVVTVRTIGELPKLEEAMRKISETL